MIFLYYDAMRLHYTSQALQLVKSFYTGIGKTTVIYPATFLVAVGMGVVNLGVIFYIRETYAVTAGQVGYFTALWSLSYITGCLLIRPLFDRVLPRYLLIGSSYLMGCLIILIPYVQNFFHACIVYGLFGLAISFFWPPIMGWLSQDVEGSELGRLLSRYNFSWSIGLIISSPLAGALSDIAVNIPIYFGGGLFFLTGLLITGASLMLPRIRSDRGIEQLLENDPGGTDSSTPLRFPAWTGILMTYVVMGIILNIFPVYARDELHFSRRMVGFLIQSRAVFATIAFALLGRAVFWHYRIGQMVAGQLVLALSVWLMSFTSSPVGLGAFIALIGVFMALSYSNSVFHAVAGTNKKAGRMAVNESIISIGLISGSAAGGILYERTSMTMVYHGSALMVVVGVIVQLGLWYFIVRRKG